MHDYNDLKKQIIDTELCTCCGTCVGICPAQTLSVKDGTIVNTGNRCIHCGQCLASCPGKSFDFKENSNFLNTDESKYSPYIGYYKNIYTGYSSSANTRNAAASGGCVTELLLFLLHNQFIDAAVVTISDGSHIKPAILSNEQDIIRAAQSKYCLSPTNTVFHEILQSKLRVAYVGLPCQIQGVRMAMKNIPALRQYISYIIGIFCGFNMTSDATAFLIKKAHIKPDEITELSYRKKINNTTGFFVSDKKRSFFVEKHGYTFLNLFYSPKRCLKCYDYSAEFADVSFGDAWECGSAGYSRIVTRTSIGEELIHRLADSNKIFIKKSSVAAIWNSQKSILTHKKLDFWIRKKCFRSFPEYNIFKPKLPLKKTIHGYMMTIILFAAHSKAGIYALQIVPFRLITLISRKLRK